MTTSHSSLSNTLSRDLAGAPAFIERQFPVARVSMESYKERKAGNGQTLTGLGKWWGRKPLVLVRAVILGLLIPVSDDPIRDRDIFLKLLTMDREGLQRRKNKSIPVVRLLSELRNMPPSLRRRFLADDETRLRAKLSREEKQELQLLVFERMPYAEKLEFCERPEQIDGPSTAIWDEINAHLGTNANSLQQLVEELGQRRFGHTPRQIVEWGIEHNELGWRADAYLYCVEVTDPESGWRVPLAPSWVIAEKNNVVAKLVPDPVNRCYGFEICEGVSSDDMAAARKGTVHDSRLMPPDGGPNTPIESIRRGMRMWQNDDLVPRPNDVFGERLYCIRWVETLYDDAGELIGTRRHYRAPDDADIQREQRVLALLRERFSEWQAQGFIPSRRIEPGAETTRLQRERGWTHWHHLFTPRQLLMYGLLMQQIYVASEPSSFDKEWQRY